jgi:hypothetical protein
MIQMVMARRWHVDLGSSREDHAPVALHVGTRKQRQAAATNAPDNALQPAVMVGVTV